MQMIVAQKAEDVKELADCLHFYGIHPNNFDLLFKVKSGIMQPSISKQRKRRLIDLYEEKDIASVKFLDEHTATEPSMAEKFLRRRNHNDEVANLDQNSVFTMMW